MQGVRPVKHSRTPRYPVREEALACPGLLERLPERWRKSRQAAVAAGLLAAITAAAAGCDKSALGGTPIVTPSALVEETPMFAGAPTAYPILSEADACKSIEDAVRAKLPALSASYKLDNEGKSVTFVTYDYYGHGSGYQVVNMKDNEIDLFDASAGVGFEYIGETDQSKSINITDQTVSAPDPDHPYVLVITPQNADDAGSKADIQKQVGDFLAWLKAEGVI